jgi:hypothetical protein
MSNTVTVSIKLPNRIAERIPAPGNGRSRFIIQTLEEKVFSRQSKQWKPSTVRGRRMAAVIARGAAAGVAMLNDDEFEQEMKARRGGNA